MKASEDRNSRPETGFRSAGLGMLIAAKCDECGCKSLLHRQRARVLRGSLKGLRGMVCVACLSKRAAPAQVAA